MQIAAIIPLFGLLVPLLPHMISGIVFLLLIIGWVLFGFFILLLGSAVILELPCQKLFPATYFDCMVSFLHAAVLGMGNFGNAGWDANIRACLI